MTLPAAIAVPAMICYSMSPNAYVDNHAQEMRGTYDGYIYVAGDWENGIPRVLGARNQPPEDPTWLDGTRSNIEALNAAGITENLLGAHMASNGTWPNAEALLSDEWTEKFRTNWGTLARTAKELGFRGISIDVEYPYPRYELDHEIYTYDGYTPGDLMAASRKQGRATMEAILDEFPEAVIFVLPGEIFGRPLEQEYQLAMLEVMAERDAPGGMHVATEYTYCMDGTITDVAVARTEDARIARAVSPVAADYWFRRCTMASGVWPFHKVETGGADYPDNSWEQELDDLELQMKVLRAVTKRYTWSYTGNVAWVNSNAEGVADIGRGLPEFEGASAVVKRWHEILRDRTPYAEWEKADSGADGLFAAVEKLDETRDGSAFVTAMGTPPAWWVLTPVGNVHDQPERAAWEALDMPVDPDRTFYGRDGAVHWRHVEVNDPRGRVECRELIGYLHTDDASIHAVTWIESEEAVDAVLHFAWDDGGQVRLGDEIVCDHIDYPERGHGTMVQDRYRFEAHVPIKIPAGRTRLAVTDVNSHGVWAYYLRITGPDGYPLPDLKFSTDLDAE